MSTVIFVSAEVDDARLTPLEFRLVGHCSRLGRSDGRSDSSAHNMADVLGLEVKTVRKALKKLEDMNVIRTSKQPGRTSIRSLNPVSQWKIDPTRKKTLPKKRVGSENGQGKNHALKQPTTRQARKIAECQKEDIDVKLL